jgi:hypothetical protein
MAEMARVGVLDLSHLKSQPYPLNRVNDALQGLLRLHLGKRVPHPAVAGVLCGSTADLDASHFQS